MKTSRNGNGYAIVVEKEGRSYGAYVPDLPGCVAVATTPQRVRKLIGEAITLHLDDMRSRGQRVPMPSARVEYVKPVRAA